MLGPKFPFQFDKVYCYCHNTMMYSLIILSALIFISVSYCTGENDFKIGNLISDLANLYQSKRIVLHSSEIYSFKSIATQGQDILIMYEKIIYWLHQLCNKKKVRNSKLLIFEKNGLARCLLAKPAHFSQILKVWKF